MNFQHMLTMGSLALGITVWAIAPVYSYQPPVTPSTPSSFTIAQFTEASSPLYGTWKLQHSVGGIVHESILVMRGYYGSMRTRYYSSQLGRSVAVDQTMTLKSSAYGLVLIGSNPVYAGTNTRMPTYNADNFLFQIRPDGTSVIVTCDDARQCSSVEVEKIR